MMIASVCAVSSVTQQKLMIALKKSDTLSKALYQPFSQITITPLLKKGREHEVFPPAIG